ncbi:MAG: aspartate aminotransferase family protein [Candidatus Brocadiaceae bacterium]|jgi:4-aminobutyrate aminotransferase/diaminobutyrate-pyruvate transaminase/4-aminobutyrate aminotransferase/(S)-3-amino-2-methylpropionate transaminase
MAGRTFELEPREVPRVETDWRRIATKFPVPESLPVLAELRRYEPLSMQGQPPVVWDRASGCQVYDPWGNVWLDWSSGVLVANTGHSNADVCRAIREQAAHGLIHNYCFPAEMRARLVCALVEAAPEGIDKAFLLTTGSEAVECAIKLSRARGLDRGGPDKTVIVTFENAFHGRTLGAQQAGGIPALKEWIVHLDPAFVQAPFPDGFRCEDTSFELFESSLERLGVDPDAVACVMTETYQGGGASFAPGDYIRRLREWTRHHDALLVMDEVQAGFGRTGTFWGFEHYGVVPDLICCGKGITSALPLSAVLGPAEVMDQFAPGTMTSTHSGNPVCAAAALANLEFIRDNDLVEHARNVGEVLHAGLQQLGRRFSHVIGAVHGRGMVAGLHLVRPGSEEPDGELAFRVVRACVERGLLLFSPVGVGSATVKICPPLVTPDEAVREGVSVLEDALQAEVD